MIFLRRFKRYNVITLSGLFTSTSCAKMSDLLLYEINGRVAIITIRNYTIMVERETNGICYSVIKSVYDCRGYLWIRVNFDQQELVQNAITNMNLYKISIRNGRSTITIEPHCDYYNFSKVYTQPCIIL